MYASRACGAEGSSCTRIPVSPIPVSTKIRKALPFESESTVPPFPVKPPAWASQPAVPEHQLEPKTRVPRLDQGA
jgi:hypothetical protein